jgi:phosphoenolpyruvate-protein phosphotransferase
LPERAVLITTDLLPSQFVALDTSRVAAICLAQGGATSHVAILAAARDIPVLVALGPEVLDIAAGTPLIVDAEQGLLEAEPGPERGAAIGAELAQRARERQHDLAQAALPAISADGIAISVYCNLGSAAEVPVALEHGAEGCGLLRTEFLFLDRAAPPDEQEQAQQYRQIAASLHGRPLTVRTLDAGGDKPLAYLELPHEDNPALGLRGIRTSLWRPALLHTQLRAILQSVPPAQCRILVPMVTDLDDLRAVRRAVATAVRELQLASTPPIGVMIETPASALLAMQLCTEADFLSVGTNDLGQYTLAMDRGHPELAARLDALHPAVLQLIALASTAAHEHGRELAVCGGLASDPAAVPLLLGLGVRELSVVPAQIPRLKREIRAWRLDDCRALAQQALQLDDARAVRAMLEAAR